MKPLLQIPEETSSTQREEIAPWQMQLPPPQRKIPLFLTVVLLVLLIIAGSSLFHLGSAKRPSSPLHHWIALHLVGTGRSNIAAIGARVMMSAGGKSWMVWVSGQDANHATNPLHVDLATLRSLDLVEIFWPDGRLQRLTGLAVDRSYTLREGDPAP